MSMATTRKPVRGQRGQVTTENLSADSTDRRGQVDPTPALFSTISTIAPVREPVRTGTDSRVGPPVRPTLSPLRGQVDRDGGQDNTCPRCGKQIIFRRVTDWPVGTQRLDVEPLDLAGELNTLEAGIRTWRAEGPTSVSHRDRWRVASSPANTCTVHANHRCTKENRG